jgi:predicted dehydrogenase
MIKIAILGIENSHAWSFASALAPKEGEKQFPDFELIGFYGEAGREDVKVGMERLAGVCSCTRYAEHYDDFLGEADAVMVTARHGGDHLKYARKYLEAGIPVWLDKPITASIEDFVEVARLQKKYGSTVTGGSTLYYTAGIKEAKKFMLENPDFAIGGAVSAPVNMVNDYGDFWFYTQHLAEMMLTVFGTDVKSVRAVKNADSVSAIYKYDTFTVNAFYGGDYAVTIYGKDQKTFAPKIDLGAAKYNDELVPFLDAIKTGKVDRTLDYLRYPVALIDATIRSFTEDKEIAITVPEI